MCDPFRELENFGKRLERAVIRPVGQGLKDIEKAVIRPIGGQLEDIAEVALPIIATIALSTVGIPPSVTNAVISAARGGSMEDIVFSAATSYAGAQIGQAVGSAAFGPSNLAIADAIALGYSEPVVSEALKNVVINASGAGATAALRGKDLEEVLMAATTAAATTYIKDTLRTEYGVDPKTLDGKLLLNSATAATASILNGKPVQDALLSSITNTAVDHGANQLFSQAKEFFKDTLEPQQKIVQSSYKYADDLQWRLNKDIGYYKYNEEQYNKWKNRAENWDSWVATLTPDGSGNYIDPNDPDPSSRKLYKNSLEAGPDFAVFSANAAADRLNSYANILSPEKINTVAEAIDKYKQENAKLEQLYASFQNNYGALPQVISDVTGQAIGDISYQAATSAIPSLIEELGIGKPSEEPPAPEPEPSPLDVLGQPMVTPSPAPAPEPIVIPGEDETELVIEPSVPSPAPQPSPLDVLGQPIVGPAPAPAPIAIPGEDETELVIEPPAPVPPFVGPRTEEQTQRFNEEFARYLDYLQAGEPPPPDYEPPPFNEPGPYWDEFNQNLLDMLEEGRLPTQWQPNEDGTFTYMSDDGSTLTINPDGSIVGYTEAPPGNLPGETPPGGGTGGGGTRPPAPAPAPRPPAPAPAPRPPAPAPRPPAPAPRPPAPAPAAPGLDVAALLALLSSTGGGQQEQIAAPQQPVYAQTPEFDIVQAFAPTLYAERKKAENPYLSGLTDEV